MRSIAELTAEPMLIDWAEMRAQDAYWARRFWQERSWRPECDYEDYAPAYCVGYVGFAQYGGDFADAEHSLCANWLRIKGDSRLGWDEAAAAIRAAWDRMAGLQRRRRRAANDPGFAVRPAAQAAAQPEAALAG